MMESLTNEVTGMLLCGKLIDDKPAQLSHDVIVRVRDECAHIAGGMYIDCEPEEQMLVDRVQQLIAEQIIGKIGND